MNIRPFLIALLLASALSTGASAAHYVVVIKDMAFGPAPAHLVVGDTIEWKNEDIFRHTATDRKGSFDFDLPPGAHAQVTLKTPGILNVYCRFHPTMKMRLDVVKP